ARLEEMGIVVEVHGSDEHPSLRNRRHVDCQWVFFWRDQTARDELDRLLELGRSLSAALDDPAAYTRHAMLALRINSTAIEVCFAMHPAARVDVDNLRARLEAGALGEQLTSALRALPHEFRIGTDAERAQTETSTSASVLAMLQAAAGGEAPLWVGW